MLQTEMLFYRYCNEIYAELVNRSNNIVVCQLAVTVVLLTRIVQHSSTQQTLFQLSTVIFRNFALFPQSAIASVNSTRPSSFSTSGKRDRRNYRFMAVTRFLTDHHVAFIRSFLVERKWQTRENGNWRRWTRPLSDAGRDRMLNFPRR